MSHRHTRTSTTPTHHYVPNAYYNSGMHTSTAHMHVVAAGPNSMRQQQQDTAAQRKRPKYTRSKTGCLTCRGKKIKVCSVSEAPARAGLTPPASATRRSPPVCAAATASARYVHPVCYFPRECPLT